jgi:hypothetical protein
MAEDRKPKIDLKSRLQKMGGPAAATPPPPTTGSIPVPSMAPPATRSGPPMAGSASVPPPGMARPSAPVPGRPPALDPGHPLAAAVAQQFGAVPAMAQAQRIEMDEGVVHQARSRAFKSGLAAGTVFGFVLLVLGYVGGNAMSEGNARSKSTRDAHDLGTDVGKAKDSLDALKAKLEAGAKSLMADRKFPADLAQALAGMNVDFAGDKLTGRRFSGVPADVTHDLFDFITRVQTLNDKKDLVVGLLNKLQKPITEELSRPAGQLPIQYVVVVDKDTPNMGAFMAPLATPIAPDDKAGVPNDLTFGNPRGGGNVKLPRLNSDKVPKDGAAITIVPATFEKVCPSKQRGQIAQLVSTMESLVGDIQGQKAAEGEVVSEPKPGLAESAAKLAERLGKI